MRSTRAKPARRGDLGIIRRDLRTQLAPWNHLVRICPKLLPARRLAVTLKIPCGKDLFLHFGIHLLGTMRALPQMSGVNQR